MPKGNPTAQTRASQRYQEKAGYMTKGFKLKRSLVEEYVSACGEAGTNPTAEVRKFMEKFIEETKGASE